MNYRFWVVLVSFCLSLGVLKAAGPDPAAEGHAEVLLAELQQLKAAVTRSLSVESRPHFVTFWDFDGTIQAGDCSEGWFRDGQWVYHGLAQRCIEAGHSSVYTNRHDFDQFWSDYQLMDTRAGHWLAYPYIAQMLRGARSTDVEALAERTFNEVFRRYYYTSSLSILRGLQFAGVEIRVLSASPEAFVRGAAASLGIPPAHIHGIRTEIRDGRLTERLVYPITWAEGKTERLQQILQEIKTARPGAVPIVLGAFGNSYSTDGPFMAWVARQVLPGGGKPVVLMINGGEPPPSYRDLFRCAEQNSYGP